VSVYAHTDPSHPRPDEASQYWEPLFTPFGDNPETQCQGAECAACARLDRFHGHLNKVAFLASQFAAEMFAPNSTETHSAAEWGRLAGLWHDLGKFAPEWQAYLKSKVDPHADEVAGRVDHSTAGAQHSVSAHPLFGHLLAYGICAHHRGLLDVKTNQESCQEARLQKKVFAPNGVPSVLQSLTVPVFPPFLLQILRQSRQQSGFPSQFFTRILFSCLVDADFLATEAFMNPAATSVRNCAPMDALARIEELVTARIDGFGKPKAGDVVNQQRAKVVEDCAAAAELSPGLFTLTVPTGGGKTLSSLLFALRHALRHGQRRVIYVVPFTSIIEQNAEVIRSIVEPLGSSEYTPLIEHHSSLSPEKETEQSRLAAENWDAPIIITTAVQFFESLYAAKTSRSRKLHRIANAVVIFDEAQTLPVDFLAPCLRCIEELTSHYNTTAVLCTATQPAIQFEAEEFPIGLREVREIVSDTRSLFAALDRVKIEHLGEVTDAHLVERLRQAPQVLCVVNRRRHAQELFRLLKGGTDTFHLSALMCPAHRSEVLARVRERLHEGLPTKLVSTQLIEAGVDVDFPVVFRALAGLDSIAQSAGRCNRHGKMSSPGEVFVFQPEDQGGEAYFRETAQVAAQVMALHQDLLGEEAIHHYFDLYYYQQKDRWDANAILESFRYDGHPAMKHCPFRFDFASVAKRFRLIDDWQQTVLIPFDERATQLIAELRNEQIPLHRSLLRGLQRYTVQIAPKLFHENAHAFEPLRDGAFHALNSPELHYSGDFGLALDAAHSAAQNLIF
jgi:CRISPR-associated endonuclease/helicase Cas3